MIISDKIIKLAYHSLLLKFIHKNNFRYARGHVANWILDIITLYNEYNVLTLENRQAANTLNNLLATLQINLSKYYSCILINLIVCIVIRFDPQLSRSQLS